MKYRLPEYVTILSISGIIIIIGNAINMFVRGDYSSFSVIPSGLIESIPGVLILLGIILAGVGLHLIMPEGPMKRFPIIGWITLVGVLLTIPQSPAAAQVVAYTGKVDLLVTATPVLAYAGISLGKDMDKLKQVGWKIAIVAFLVFGGTFLGSAVVGHTVLKMQGLI